MLVIRMRRVGSKKKPYFRLVVGEARSKVDSDFVENLGTYHPRAQPAKVSINKERIQHWISKGARPSDSVRTLLARHLTQDLGVVEAPAATAETPAAPGQ
jgi:small subunit ribosomal protein S16